jgi:hypothetical protein
MTPPPEATLGDVALAPGGVGVATPPPPTTAVLGEVAVGAVVVSVVDGSLVGGAVVGGAVVGGAVVGGSVVGGAVVAGSVVGGPVESGGSCASAARRLAAPANSSPTVAVASTTTRSERLAAASSRRRWPGAGRCLGCGRSVNSRALKTANFPTQRTPNASSELLITIAVVAGWEAPAPRARVLPRSAAQVERARPRKASAQNGMTSFHRWERPRRPQAQLRFR